MVSPSTHGARKRRRLLSRREAPSRYTPAIGLGPRAASGHVTAECWGEFLDHEWYYAAVMPRVKEPWRRHPMAVHSFLFPRELISTLAQDERLREVRSDHERIETIRSSLLQDGLCKPLELVVDAQGRLVLWDGHHRLLASEGISWLARLPAYFTRSESIRVLSQPVADLLEALLRASVACYT